MGAGLSANGRNHPVANNNYMSRLGQEHKRKRVDQ